MSTPLNALTFLGPDLLTLYQAKYGEVTPETEVVKIDRHQIAILGVRIRLYEPMSVFAPSLTPPPSKVIAITPEEFELWALSKDGPYFRLAYEPTLKRIYGARIP